ncbi:hypothetical protein [Sphingomonas jatrophae]|uniref:Uncharacterized protein n=1 Tax=Sphingomonas jatrophae TaxID=1166337 RepID=A0A1I6MAA8_9SPHN|nr:hypothetical protein [Sphingomonas jatrophae]SFS12482.1 hypothetical protein SAMN05192580_3754 [Sphingomonas jatrophae]
MDRHDAAALAADMARLGARPYSEVGVPMFLVAEDLRGDLAVKDEGEPKLAAALRDMAVERPEPADTARLIEVLADRHILGADGPAFTRLSDEEVRR